MGLIASAGGLDAYIKFFRAASPDSGMAYVVVPHLDPARESMTVSLVAGTPVQIEHVLINLMQNAIDAFDGSTAVPAANTVRTIIDHERLARAMVQDNGPGIDDKVMERLFERFYTTKRNGLGIGLVIGRTLIESHDGRLWAERPAEGGVAFHFTLPLSP